MKRMMKAMKAMVAAAAVAVSFAANAAVYHDPGTGFDWAYSVINGNEAMLSNVDRDIPYQPSAISRLSAEGEIAIPAYMGGYRVTAIGPEAFQECSLMTKVTIPDGVTDIGAKAFWGCSRLESITLPNSAKQIGDYAFLNCVALRSVDLGTGLETLGKSAFLRTGIIDLTLSTSLGVVGSDVFRYCESLTQVTIPGSLNTVGRQMFDHCTSLNSVTISSGVTTIDAYAFADSTSLEYVTIPSTVTAIENNAFRNCPLKAVYVGFGETARVRNLFLESNFDGYATLNIVEEAPVTKTVTFNSNGGTSPNVFRKYVQGSPIVKVPRPKKPGYSYTGWWTAESGGTQISSETIVMDNVTYYAQWEEGENKTLVDDDGVRWNAGGSGYEGSRTVYSYYPQTRKNATIPTAHANGDVIAAIHEQFSWGSTKPLESIMIPATIASIQMNAFGPGSGAAMSFPNLKTVYVNKNDAARIEGLLRGTSYAANVDNLTFVETDPFYFTVTFDVNGGNALATTTKEVEFGAPCGSLPVPTRTDGANEWQFVGWFTSASGGDEVTAATILQHKSDHLLDRTLYAHWREIIEAPVAGTWVDSDGRTWHYETLAGQATIYNSGDCAVDPEPSGELVIPSVLGGCPVTAIGYKAFFGCRGITALTIPSSVRKIKGWAFEDCNGLTSLVLPDSVASIDNRAFMGCYNLMSVYVPAGAALAADMEFRDCFNLRDPEKDYLVIVNGVLYDWKPYGTPLATIKWPKIPSGVTTIAVDAFSDDNPERVTIPETVTSIKEDAFYRCSDTLTTIYYRPGDSEARIRSLFAAGNTGIDISTITVAEEPEFTVTFNANGGTGGSSVQREYAEAIGALPRPTRAGYTYIGWFDDPEGGTQIVSADKVRGDVTYYAHWQSEGDPKWTDNDGFTWSYQIDDGKAIARGVAPNSKAVDLVVPATLGGYVVTGIGLDCFRTFGALKSIVIPPGVTEIGTYAFYRCRALESVSLPSGLTRIGSYAFYECSSLASVTIPASVTLIDTAAFGDCDSLTSVILPSGVTTVGDYAFGSCAALESVTIPKSLTSFGSRMFNNVTTITTIYVEFGDTTRVRTKLEATELDCTGINFIEGAAPPTFTVTFNGNGGTPGEASRFVEQNTAVGELPSASRAGYWAFDGWWTAETGGTQVDASTLVTADVEYFAHWTDTTPPDYATILGAPAGMTFASSGDKTWADAGTVDEKTTVKSGNIGNSQSSTLTATFSGPGTLSFWYKVSSEETFDQLEFFMDGGGNCLAGTYKNSGTVDWTKYEYELGAGDHTVVWKYSKDSSTSSGSDCAWIAEVSFVESTPPTQYTVTFNGNGGTIGGETTTTRQVNDGAAVGELPAATRDGNWAFNGWWTEATGGTQIYATTTVTADAEYFAHWLDTTPPDYAAVLGAPAGMSFASSGDKAWISGGTVDEKTTVKSGNIGDIQTSVLTATFSSGTAILSFYYKVSSETGCDKLIVTVDGDTVLSKAGEVSWTKCEVELAAGDHTVVWTYQKDHSQSRGSDSAWIAEVGLAQIVKRTVTFNGNGGTIGGEATTTCQVIDGAAVCTGTGGEMPTPTRAGYWEFLGWFTEETGGTQIYATTTVTADAEYFAHWLDTTPPDYAAVLGAPAGMSFASSGDKVWISGGTVDGKTAVKSGNIGDIQTSVLTATFSSGTAILSFYYKVSSESGCDTLVVTVDGDTVLSKGGEVSWTKCEVELAAGDHTVVWTYQKDSSQSRGSDCAWLAEVGLAALVKRTVTFDANGGTIGGEATTTCQVLDGAAVGTLPTPTRAGYWEFLGWFTEETGGTQIYATTTVTADAEYFAHWLNTAPPDYNAVLGAPAGMTFAASGDKPWFAGGTEEEKTTVKSGNISDNQTSVLTATFSGAGVLSFYCKVDSESSCDYLVVTVDGEEFVRKAGPVSWTKYEKELAAGDHTVVWTYLKDHSQSTGRDSAWIAEVRFGSPATKYTVTFDKNEGDSVSEASREVDEGDPVGSPLPTASRAGDWSFDGWFTAASGGTQIDGSETVTADVIYYAHWTSTAPVPEKGSWTDTDTEITWYYETFDGKATIVKGDGVAAVDPAPSGVLTIPATLGGCPVTAIGYYAFYDCDGLTGVEFPSTLTTIGNRAFMGCNSLASIDLPASVTSIGSEAFRECNVATSVSVPVGAAMDNMAFKECYNLQEPDNDWLVIVNGVVFDWYGSSHGLTKATIPSGVTAISGSTFYGKSYMTSIKIPATVNSIGASAFRGSGLTTVYYDSGDTESRVKALFTEATGKAASGLEFIAEGAPLPTTYTVTFDANGGKVGDLYITTRQVSDGSEVGELPAATIAGYTQNGWWADDDTGWQATESTTITADITFYAHWTPNEYEVTFNANGGDSVTPSSKQVTYDQEYGELATATRAGNWEFAGWFTDAEGGSQVTASTTVKTASGHTLYAHWTNTTPPPTQYTVTFNGNGGLIGGAATTTRQVNDGAEIGSLPTATLTGYTQNGWWTAATGGTEVYTDTSVTADTEVFAHWTPNTYTVYFDGNGGTPAEASKPVTYDSTYGTLPSATRDGNWTLEGWWTTTDDSGVKVEETTTVKITDDQTLYAHWTDTTPTQYTVWFNANGGSCTYALTKVNAGAAISTGTAGALPTPTHTNPYMVFIGWFTQQLEGDSVGNDYIVNGNGTIYAHWNDTTPTPPSPTWTVEFNANGGTCSAEPFVVDDGATIGSVGALPAATRTGYTQNGWWTAASGGSEVTTATTISEDTEVYAHWTANTYTVTFDKNGGDSVTPASKQVTYDSTYGELATATRAGYWSFDGWWTAASGGDQVTAATTVKITAAQTLYAHWTETTPPPPTWTVTFNANGGSCSEAPRAVDDGDPIGALPAATRTGYTQNGWWTAATGGTEVYTDTPVAADTEVYAHWTPNTYTVYFDGNGGTPSAASITVTYDSTYGAMPTAELDGWSFDGWWTAAEGGTLVTASSAVTITDDQTLYAHWTDSGYVVTFDANGGVAEFDRVTREFSAAVGSMPQAVKDGCALLGWFTEPYGGGTEVTPATVVTASFTCYAVWNENDGDSIYKTAVVDGIEWTYRVLGSSAELYNRGNPVIPADTVGAITVPAKLDGMAVATIKDRAFYGCTGITAVIIPDSVTGIGVDAFAFCSSLEVVQCGKKVSGVDHGAFRYCTSLIAVEFKNANPIFPDDDMTTFEGANSIYWQINVPKTANKWPDTWRGRGVNKYPYNAHITVDFSDPAENPEYGKITKFTNTEIGKKLALKATANKGYASAGWYDGETGELITRAASYSYTVTGEDRVFLADFVTADEDIASLAIALPDVTTATDGSIEIDLGAATESYSEPKFAVKGLPSGLKYDAKTQKITGKAAKPGIYTVEVKATNVSQKQATAASTATFEIVVPNKTDPEILVADFYGEYIPGVEYVETIPEAVGCKAAGLPTGMKWTEKDIVDKTTGAVITPAYSFYGAATKPGNYTVTFTKTIGKDKHEATATVAVGPLPKLTLTAVGYVDGYKVTGAGDYPANKGVSLKATAGAGNVFSCWIDVETGDIISRAANYTYTMADHDKTLYAEFTTATEDAANLGLNVGGFAQYDKNKIMVDDNAVWNETTIPQGVYVEWPLVPQTVSLATIAVSGLPTGLKFTAKDIVDSKTKAVIVPANTIYGVPTAASKNVSGVYTPSRVKIAMTTAGKVKSEYTLDVTVTAMEPWAVGPFNGGYNNICQATLTVASSGKISGKLLFFDGDTCTFAADSFSSFDGSIYTAHVAAKLGGETSPFTLRIGEGEIGGEAQLVDEGGNVKNLWQTDWKSDKWKAIAAPFAKAGSISLVEADKSVALKFDTSGAVKLAGEFFVNSTWIKASSSATVIPTEMYGDDGSFGGWVFIYFPPKTGKYDGIVRRQYLRWSAADKSFSFDPPAP